MEAQWKSRNRLRHGDKDYIPFMPRRTCRTLSLVSASSTIHLTPFSGLTVTSKTRVTSSCGDAGAGVTENGKRAGLSFRDIAARAAYPHPGPTPDCERTSSSWSPPTGIGTIKTKKDSLNELAEAIAYSHRREKSNHPAFAVRELRNDLFPSPPVEGRPTAPDMPVFVDSPLAIQATEIFRKRRSIMTRMPSSFLQTARTLSSPDHYALTTRNRWRINSIEGLRRDFRQWHGNAVESTPSSSQSLA